jgi:hypothetical protein
MSHGRSTEPFRQSETPETTEKDKRADGIAEDISKEYGAKYWQERDIDVKGDDTEQERIEDAASDIADGTSPDRVREYLLSATGEEPLAERYAYATRWIEIRQIRRLR